MTYAKALTDALASKAVPGTALVVVNYGSSALLTRNLHPALADHDVHVVVVDNWSGDDERQRVCDLATAHGWILVAPQANLGFGEGVNAGVLHAATLGYRTFITLNPDAVAEPAVLAALSDSVRGQSRSLASPVLLTSTGGTFFRGSTIDVGSGRIKTGWVEGDQDSRWKNWLSGACLAFSGSTFAEVGGFQGDYFLYWEDVDLSRRAAELGIELTVLRDLTVVHDEGGTQDSHARQGKSPLYYYYNTRNRLLFCSRLAPHSRAKWLWSTPRESYRIWRRGGRRQVLSEPEGVWAAVRGTVAGLRLVLTSS